jgi:hypothetical protein
MLPIYHYWNPALYRVPNDLPSVLFRPLDKEALCHGPNTKHSVKKHSTNPALCRVPNDLSSVLFRPLDKEALCHGPNTKHSVKKHSTKSFFAECFILDTRQIVSLPSVLFLTLGKDLLC